MAGCVESANKQIVYKAVSEQENQSAREALFQALQGNDGMADLSMPFIICGPYLTENLEGDHIQGVSGKVIVPVYEDGQLHRMLEMNNKLLQGKPQVALFWETLLKKYSFSDVIIRKLTEDEKKLYWALIPYDIEEPIFAAQTDKVTILIDFAKEEGSYKIFYVDELAND